MSATGGPQPSEDGVTLPQAQAFQPAEHWVQLAQQGDDDDGVDTESALGTHAATSTASLSSSILRYRTIHGRTYHSEQGNAEYWASNDEQQNESQDVNHHAMLLVLNDKLFLAPLKNDIQKVLDVGTGTGMASKSDSRGEKNTANISTLGIWAIDFADEFPSATVIGTDLSPIQPSWIPPNLTFEIEDCNLTWTFEPDSFDYVHLRYLFGSITDWNALFSNAYRVCKPGGWVESYEPTVVAESDDDTIPPGSAHSEWGKFFIEGAKKMGRSCTVVEDDVQRKSMEATGFVDLQYVDKKVPIGGWPRDPKQKEIGQYLQASLEQDLEGYVLYMASQLLGWTKEEVSVYCAQFRREIRSGKYHAFFQQRVIWGRKPE
ncbi:hypothetical protein BHE90_017352 [Fusarium euwallaceae]|uniref:Methyltransferase domain-containing protein n=2 Tax=Fusarium solani species complex TaxID=232080 RepID=A0A430KXQ2_9HYPO|nr:hypothetical protein BHE90_017352 [Fusarium euwallaceae]